MGTARNRTNVTDASVRRLPVYLRFLNRLSQRGVESVSCREIARETGTDPAQVRGDILSVGACERVAVAYPIGQLIDGIESFLGWHNVREAFIVGVGGIGKALMGFRSLEEQGLRIVAGFDVDPAVIGTEVHGKPVHHIDDLPGMTEALGVRAAVLAVPPAFAQATAERLVDAGVVAIWSFAAADLELPDGVLVEDADFTPSLAVFTQRISELS